MNNYEILRVACVTPKIKIADPENNTKEIVRCMKKADKNSPGVIIFPELCITGATCGDLFLQEDLYQSNMNSLKKIIDKSKEVKAAIILGTYIQVESHFCNCALVIQQGNIRGVTPKKSSDRWFRTSPFKNGITLFSKAVPFGEIIFQDIESGFDFSTKIGAATNSPIDTEPAHIIFNIAAIPTEIGQDDYLRDLIRIRSMQELCAYVFTSAGVYESSTDYAYAGKQIIAEYGEILAENNGFERESNFTYAEIDFGRIKSARRKTEHRWREDSNRNEDYCRKNSTKDEHYCRRDSNKNEDYCRKNSTKDEHYCRKDPNRNEDYCRKNSTNDEHYCRKHLNRGRHFHGGYSEVEVEVEVEVDAVPLVQSLKREYPKNPFMPVYDFNKCDEIFNIQTAALAKRIEHLGSKKLVVGISGGLDSTVALLVAVETMRLIGKKPADIITVTMPGFGTSNETYKNAQLLMSLLGCDIREVDIADSVMLHFKDIGHDPKVKNLTYENAQARERTQILMDMAGDEKAFMLGTGDLSELALGWCTYGGDHLSMYSVNSGIPKTVLPNIIKFYTEEKTQDRKLIKVLEEIISTPISPELLPPDTNGEISQKTEDAVGPYELHDFFIYYALMYGFSKSKILFIAKRTFKNVYTAKEIEKWLDEFYRRLLSQQYKRSCMPDGPKVFGISLSPRGGLQMPSDAAGTVWE